MAEYRIPFNRVCPVGTEPGHMAEAMAGGHLSGNGPFGRRCEARLVEITGAHRALLTGSCTHALEMSAHLLSPEPGDEVVLPSFTFVSTANGFATRGMTPVFADCREDTLNIDPAVIARLLTPRTRAIVAMHYGGVACDMDEILDIARARNLVVVEDNAHGLFGRYKGRPLGSLGAMATQSFHETKNVTCGEGGALLLNDPALVERAEIVREKGTNRSRFFRGEVDKYTWVDVGSNYMASELQAAFLWGQLSAWQAIQQKRRAIWDRYHTGLRDWAEANGARLPVVPPHCDHPSHLYYLLLPAPDVRPRLIDHLKARSILAVFHYVPLHLSPMGRRFGGAPGDCPVTEDVSQRLLRLPFYADLGAGDQRTVIDAVRAFRA